MSNKEITHEQAVAVLATIYHELKVILKTINTTSIKDDKVRRKRILTDVKYILQKVCKADLNDTSLFNLLNSRS